ncbi:MAG: hypothetical protein Ct9H300mP7_2250 [Verrucomicrobiota bacterium]|nr:MAG: hypothetical protein Ct9H300mP7_2250 [Verrucomicrobiota bacterium]
MPVKMINTGFDNRTITGYLRASTTVLCCVSIPQTSDIVLLAVRLVDVPHFAAGVGEQLAADLHAASLLPAQSLRTDTLSTKSP